MAATSPGVPNLDHFFSSSAARLDRWRALNAKAQAWAADARGGRPGGGRAAVEAALAEVRPLEDFFAFPGHHLTKTLAERIANDDALGTARLVRRMWPVRDKGLPCEGGLEVRAGSVGHLPQRRPRQPELGRHGAARGILPARAIRYHREQAGARPAARRRRHAQVGGHSRPSRSVARQPRRHAGCALPAANGAVGRREVRLRLRQVRARARDSIIGDHYPVPDRMLVHNEQVVHEYLQWVMCGAPHPKGKFKIHAVEGGTAAMCYIFKSLKSNRILNPGDTIALGVPIFTPYLEMAHLEDYDLKFVEVHATQEHRFQYPDEELKKLLDPKIKAFFIVNPGNPYAVAIAPDTIRKIGAILKKRPDLILLTDDVYGGSGFAAPDWSVRISFANLDDHVYDDIGRAVRAIARGYRQAYEAATGEGGKPAGARKAPVAKRKS